MEGVTDVVEICDDEVDPGVWWDGRGDGGVGPGCAGKGEKGLGVEAF